MTVTTDRPIGRTVGSGRRGSTAYMPFRGTAPWDSSKPATALALVVSYAQVEDESRRRGPDAVWVGFGDGLPSWEAEDIPRSTAGGYLTPDDADRVAETLAEQAAATRGAKHARDLTVADRIIIDGEEHGLLRVVADRDSGVAVYTERGGRRHPAARYCFHELVKLPDPGRGLYR